MTEPVFVLEHRPNLRRVEIEITTRCNLMCRHCDRRCSQAPAHTDMPLSRVEEFVKESLCLEHSWECVSVLGGEPTLHPDLYPILKVLKGYVRSTAGCELSLVTNAHGEHVNRVLEGVPDGVKIIRRPKTPDESWFNNMDIAPIDLSSTVTTCHNTSRCGLGLSDHGYFPCGAGAAIARTLDLDIGITSLRDVDEDSMADLLLRLCLFCGHSLAIPAGKQPGSSPFWEEATARYRSRSRRCPTGLPIARSNGGAAEVTDHA